MPYWIDRSNSVSLLKVWGWGWCFQNIIHSTTFAILLFIFYQNAFFFPRPRSRQAVPVFFSLRFYKLTSANQPTYCSLQGEREKGGKKVLNLATLALLPRADVPTHIISRSNKRVSFYTFELNLIRLSWSRVSVEGSSSRWLLSGGLSILHRNPFWNTWSSTF